MKERIKETGARAAGRSLSRVMVRALMRTIPGWARFDLRVSHLSETAADLSEAAAGVSCEATSENGATSNGAAPDASTNGDGPGLEMPHPTVLFGTLGPKRADPNPHQLTPAMKQDQDRVLRVMRAAPLPAGEIPDLYATPEPDEQ
jgi:hypothetical protein